MGRHHAAGATPCHATHIAVGHENIGQSPAECRSRSRGQRQQRIEHWPHSGLGRIADRTGEQPGLQRGADIKDGISDRHTPARHAIFCKEHAERQVLDGSAWPLADATQLKRVGSCVASVMSGPRHSQPSAHRADAIYLGVLVWG